MSRFALGLAAVLVLIACQGTGSTAADVSMSPSAPAPSQSAALRELPGAGPLDPGSYTRAAFRPPVTFVLDEGWSVGSVTTGFFDVQQQTGTPDVIAVQFANVNGVVGDDGQQVEATAAAEAAEAVAQLPGLTVLGESASRLGGLNGRTIEVENATEAHVGILDVPPGRLGIDPERRLWLSLLDTEFGVLAVMVGGSVGDWDHALLVAEPVLESVVIG